MNKFTGLAARLAVFLLLLIASCKSSEDLQPNPPGGGGGGGGVVPVDDATQVIASVYGTVLDEGNTPIAGATVTSGIATTTTNAFGLFYLSNISLSKNNGAVTISKTGYFKGVRTFKTTAGKNHYVKMQLMQKALTGTVNGATGGTVTSFGGASVNFPAAAFVTASGAAYTGTVNVYSRWINPTANNLPYIIPGDLRGVSTTNVEGILETYGMLGAELEDGSGNPLSIATGKTATVNFPIPAALQASAPASIALWHFDNATARWKEEGTATRSGSTYIALVNKFSFWNCDVTSTNFINLDLTLINSANGMPLVNTLVKIRVAGSGASAHGHTNNTGFVSGLVPRNTQLVLEVVAGDCANPVYSQNIGPFSSNTSLGNLPIALPASSYINFSGKVLNCSAAPVTNGYVSLVGSGGNHGFSTTDANGNFSFSILNCTGANLSYDYMAVDLAASQQSTVFAGLATSNTVNLGNITACAATSGGTGVYVSGFEPPNISGGNNIGRVWKNGVATDLTDGLKNGLCYGVYVVGNDVYACGRDQDPNALSVAKMWKNGVATNLTSGTMVAQANGIFANATDAWVIGSEHTTAKLWKNGVATNLTNGNTATHGMSVFVVGTDVYAVGNEANAGIYWKNGVQQTYLWNAQFNSIYVSGTDVYIAGSTYNGSKSAAAYWKNGVATTFTNYVTDAKASNIFVSGTDVYVTGQETNVGNFFTVAKLWKNGVVTNLTNGLHFGSACAVQVVGSDVYVAGNDQINGNQVIIVWKNGFPTNITDGTRSAFATGLFVK